MNKAKATAEVYAIKITLLGTQPVVWRRVLLPRDTTLHNLHRTLQTVMGWTDSHIHQFVLEKQTFAGSISLPKGKVANEHRTKLGELMSKPGARLLYEYDFGDGWCHELLLEEILLAEEPFQAGGGCCPPEDSGGPQGFAELLQALRDVNHPGHQEASEWLGDFDPELFSADEINRRLRRRRR